MPLQPRDVFIEAGDLRLRVVLYGDESKPPLLLLHGFMDQARAWDFAAEHLAARYFCVAPDFRGFGDSAWEPGGKYFFASYQLDVTAVVEAMGWEQVAVAGHSMGGNVAAQWAGVFPSKVSHLILAEGFGPPERDPASFPERTARWVKGILGKEREHPRSFSSMEEAASRLMESHPRLSVERATHWARQAVRAKGEGFVWKFDPAHRLPSPHPYLFDEYAHFLRRIRAPVLALHGAEGPVSVEAMHARYAHIPDLRIEVVEDAGHGIHVEQPEETAMKMLNFLTEPRLSKA